MLEHWDTCPHPLRIEGLNKPLSMWVHNSQDQHVSKSIVESGIWEAYETQLIMKRLQGASVFVDVGANIGYYTLLAADQFNGRGFIAAFEPNGDNFLLLEKNLKQNNFGNIECVNAALSNDIGQGELFLNTQNFGDHQIYDNGEGRSKRNITLLRGDDFLRNKINHIDLLKIDTQGAECKVVSGLLPLLSKSTDQLSVVIEFWPYGLRKAGDSAHQLLDLLESLNLPFSIIDHLGCELLPCSIQQLRGWVDMVEENPQDEGFMNILVGE